MSGSAWNTEISTSGAQLVMMQRGQVVWVPDFKSGYPELHIKISFYQTNC